MFVFLLFISKDLFYNNFLIIQYTLDNKIKATILINTYNTSFNFINEKCIEIIYKRFEI